MFDLLLAHLDLTDKELKRIQKVISGIIFLGKISCIYILGAIIWGLYYTFILGK